MWRIRIFRVLLPMIILGFVVALWWRIDWVGSSTTAQPGNDRPGESTENAEVKKLYKDETTFTTLIARGERGPGGESRVFGIQETEIYRGTDRAPLKVSAPEGLFLPLEQGEHRVEFDRGVTIVDPDLELRLQVPTLTVDPIDGTAISPQPVTLDGNGMTGGASRLSYGLEGQPTELADLDLTTGDGVSLKAKTALLHDGARDMEFLGTVEIRSKEGSLNARRVRVKTTEEQIRRLEASGNVLAEGIEGLRAEGGVMEIDWSEAGKPEHVLLSESAVLTGPDGSIAAQKIDMRREASGIRIDAGGSVAVEGSFADEPGWLRSDALIAQLTPDMKLKSTTATGSVRYDGRATRAEAQSARYDAATGIAVWTGSNRRKARLARDSIRVAAETLEWKTLGEQLNAQGGVEATLLSGDGGASSGGGIFRAGEAVHFVSESLVSEAAGSSFVFEGAVRGWQGSRNLTADKISIQETERKVVAEGNVHSRFPRAADGDLTREQDYIQIAAGRLEYLDADGLARYEGGVKTRLVEGWIESTQLEVRLGGPGRSIDRVTAAGSVRLEFRKESDTGAPDLLDGTADRMVYLPLKGEIRLIGEKKPASVRRLGPSAATTQGRVLVYHTGTGQLEVESDASGPARIEGVGR